MEIFSFLRYYCVWQYFSITDTAVYALSCLLISAVILGGRHFFRKVWRPDCGAIVKADAYIVSILTSVVMCTVGTIVMAQVFGQMKGITDLGTIRRLMEEEPFLGRALCLYFLAHCHMDLILGNIFYPAYLDIIIAYVHHAIYTFTILELLCRRNTFLFGLFAIDELPNIMLALGTIHKPFRTDLSFEIVWYVFRIFYHTIVMIYMACLGPGVTGKFPLLISFLALLTHIEWIWRKTVRRLASLGLIKPPKSKQSEQEKEKEKQQTKRPTLDTQGAATVAPQSEGGTSPTASSPSRSKKDS
uniref:Uncharacterized protein n=1 Tax=Chromera velia CCMP2878 TaxID=1169474 RepID=A0A0G4HV49_9ALVE|eukprot:Cvel_32050.t1-p1 / transcript=Cvel_32050.t1 / gene=Cvel_32050 / organism=Chromera_velia_CCMP2878 / gene_product=hypothetical protein / transcript_product=hypothetical protein / location=Cvel_scaffold4894:5198-6798(+) / protein_length=300 / sequence_SO=supercontig / SO=protein_coding / is_pseudo=false